MQKMFICALLTFSILSVSSTAKTIDPLPPKFTQAWTTMFENQVYQTGKIFYDTETLSERINVIDNSDFPVCGFLEPITQCSLMTVNDTIYVIAQEAKQCCYDQQDDIEIIPRDVFQDFEYKGDKDLNGVSYEKWFYGFEFFDAQLEFIVYNDKVNKGVMRRLELSDLDDESEAGWFDFWPDSYTDKFNSKVAFEVPKYCVPIDQCSFDLKSYLSKVAKKNFFLNLLKQKDTKKTEELRQE